MSDVEILHIDCMEYLVGCCDDQFDLAIIDPPYGIGASKPTKKPNMVKQKNGDWLRTPVKNYKAKDWDNTPFGYEMYLEVKRVSKNQIIFGCNFFDFQLKGGRLIWDKLNGNSDQHDAEIAYCSIGNRVDIVRYMWRGMFQGLHASNDINKANRQQGNKSLNEKRIHQTQKPVALYKWILDKYAKPGDKILDTHGGSMSLAIACHDKGFNAVICEIDEDHFNDGFERFIKHTNQLTLF